MAKGDSKNKTTKTCTKKKQNVTTTCKIASPQKRKVTFDGSNKKRDKVIKIKPSQLYNNNKKRLARIASAISQAS